MPSEIEHLAFHPRRSQKRDVHGEQLSREERGIVADR